MADKVVLVTGANGFLASHVIKELLDSGCRVNGTVRKLNPEIVKDIKSLSPNAEQLLELHEATLESDAGWEKAAIGCTSLIHIASPLPACITDTEFKDAELVVPARDGTIRALQAAVGAGIKKVVLTGAASNMYGISRQKKDLYKEDDWADPSDNMDAYYKSKIIAERAAWEFLKKLPDKDKFELTVISPGTVSGPVLLKNHIKSCSVNILVDILNCKTPNVPNISFTLCDVRDVAKAHIMALSEPHAVGRRIPIVSGSLWFWDIILILKNEFECKGYKINSKQASNFVVRLYANMVRAYKKTIVPKVDIFYRIDDKPMKEIFKLEPISMEESLKSTIYSAIQFGGINPPQK